MEQVKLDNKRILFNLLPAHVAQHFLTSNPRSMVRARLPRTHGWCAGSRAPREVPPSGPPITSLLKVTERGCLRVLGHRA